MESAVLVAAEEAMDFASYETSRRDALQRADSICMCSWSDTIALMVVIMATGGVEDDMTQVRVSGCFATWIDGLVACLLYTKPQVNSSKGHLGMYGSTRLFLRFA